MPNFPWRPWMLTLGGVRLTEYGERSLPPINALPDLADPATVGCLDTITREAWAARGCCLLVDDLGDDGFEIEVCYRDNRCIGPVPCRFTGQTKGDALMAAWKAAT